MGTITDLIEGTPNILADPDGRKWHEAFKQGGKKAMEASQQLVAKFAQGTLSPALNYQPGNPAYTRVWQELIQSAEDFNNPPYFTTFIAYEWTSLAKGNNLHRNVIFRDGAEQASQVVPYTTTPPRGLRHHRATYAGASLRRLGL
jgi:hypothetical protein